MSVVTSVVGSQVERVDVGAYQIPTATEHESDGTLRWDSTSVVIVEVAADGHRGLGYTYCHPAAAQVIKSKLADVIQGADALMPERCWAEMQVELRQLGHAGIAAMAISAVDVALWDLKARLLGVSLGDLLPRFHESVPIYGSGGFCNYDSEELAAQIREWVSTGFRSVKIKVGRNKPADLGRLDEVRARVSPNVEVMVDGNGAYGVQDGLEWAQRFRDRGVRYFEEPLSSQDLAGLAELRRRAPAGLAIAAGEYGWNLPYFERMLDADAVHILQADVTRCGGITNMLRIDGLCKARNLPFSAHCAPAISAHVCCGMESLIHIEYFFDHYRIEDMLFEGTLDPSEGLLTPDRSRPGLGLELKRDEAERYRVPTGGGD